MQEEPGKLSGFILNAKAFVEEEHKDDTTGHDLYHIERVVKLGCFIAERENADSEIVELAAWLHDLDDWKKLPEGEASKFPLTTKWMNQVGLPIVLRERVFNILGSLSFKGGKVSADQKTLEGKVVQDADRLDAMGAIGIARTFTYGGSKNRPLYVPHIKPHDYHTFEEYKNKLNHTINHFHEKLLLLKDKMNTPTGRFVAELRHDRLNRFLKDFYQEWEGDDYAHLFGNSD